MEEKTCETCGNRCNSLCDDCKFYDGVECHQQADECRECTRGQNWIPENPNLTKFSSAILAAARIPGTYIFVAIRTPI